MRDLCRFVASRILSVDISSGNDGEMPKVNPPATNVKKFEGLLKGDFQERFDAWKLETESAERGTVEITHEEIIAEGMELLIFYRVVPKPTVARPRR